MVATVAGFVTRFPEFGTTPAQRAQAVLADVELRVSATYGALRDQVVYLELADTLSASTTGRNARTTKDQTGSKQSVYAAKLAELQNVHALGRRVQLGRRVKL